MRRALLIAVVALAGFAGAAELFKWTDRDGNIHFGDAPPADAIGVEKLGIKSAPTDTARLESLEVQKDLRDKQSTMEDELRVNQQKRAAEEAEAKQKFCDAARKRYENIQHSRKFATTGADGKEAWMSGADADKMKADLKAAADKACEGL
jgi:Domain of unknown function (DUF4124)